MSGNGDPWDPNRLVGSYCNPFPGTNGATSSGIDLTPYSNVGLFGGGYATWLKQQAANGTLPSPAEFGAPTDFSSDGTGLPPSVTATANLRMHTDSFASLQQVLDWGAGGDSSAVPTQSAEPLAATSSPSALLDEAARQPPFNMNDQALAAIRSQAENRVGMDTGAKELLGPLAGFILPEWSASELVEGIVSGLIDLYNNKAALQEEQTMKNASDGAVLKALNDSEAQQLQGRSLFPRR